MKKISLALAIGTIAAGHALVAESIAPATSPANETPTYLKQDKPAESATTEPTAANFPRESEENRNARMAWWRDARGGNLLPREPQGSRRESHRHLPQFKMENGRTIYLFLSAFVVGIWLLQPAVFLLAFLFISAFHFSGDPAAGTPWTARALYGGAVVILPAALHAVETTRLFSLLAGESATDLAMPWLVLLSWPWLAGLILAAIQRMRTDWLTALELFSVGILSVVAPPLLSFTLFFCAMHSARHILRTIDYSAKSSSFFILGAALLPMFGVLAVSLVAWYFLRTTPIDARIIQIVFVGLATLTVPHMALVERVRLSGWGKTEKNGLS